MFGSFLQWVINFWLRITGRKVQYSEYPWLRGPMADSNIVGDRFYEQYARAENLTLGNQHTGGLIDDFASLIPDTDPLKEKLNPRVRHFYEHTTQYKLEVWSQWYTPIQYFARILIRSVSTKMDQLNIPLEPLETSRGMTNEVLHLNDPHTGRQVCACWLRKAVLSGRVVYAGFYSGVVVNGIPSVKVAFPLPGGNVTVLLKVVVQQDGSVKLISDGKRIGETGYYRVRSVGNDGASVRFLPLKECIHVYEDNEGVMRTDHEFAFWHIRFLLLHYKILPRS